MTIQDLFKQVDFINVWDTMNRLYPDQGKNYTGYKYVYDYVCTCTPMTEDKYIIYIEPVEEEKEQWYDIYGVSYIDGESYGLDFSLFDKWAGYDINNNLLDTMSLEEITCHILYEMTFYGFTNEQIEKTAQEITQALEQVKNNPETTVSWEEVLAEMEE